MRYQSLHRSPLALASVVAALVIAMSPQPVIPAALASSAGAPDISAARAFRDWAGLPADDATIIKAIETGSSTQFGTALSENERAIVVRLLQAQESLIPYRDRVEAPRRPGHGPPGPPA